MKLYYKAVTKDGKILKGVVDAKEPSQAAIQLRQKNLLPLSIATKQEGSFVQFFPFWKKTSAGELAFLTRQLSSMLTSGLTLMQSLTILRNQMQKQATMDMLEGVISEIEDGKPFSQSLAKYPDVFSSVYISLVKAGESSGLLDKVILRLADNLEKEEKLRSAIRGALMYPIIVISAMVIVVVLMLIFVIPQLSTFYENLNIPLPLPTRIILGISTIITNFWPLVIGLFGMILTAFRHWYNTDAGRLTVDSLLLKIPIFGKLIRQIILTEFTRTLGLLVGSGTLVIEAFRQASEVAGNTVYKNAINSVGFRIEKGVAIGDALNAYSIFPPILVQMVKIGEQTGKLDESFIRVSEYFEREVDETIKTLTIAMEPVIMIVLGVGIAFLIISIITPIYNITSSLQ